MYPDNELFIPEGSELLISDHHGQYIPQIFAQQFRDRVTSASSKEITDEDWNILLDGPEQEFYWDVWTDVLDNCVIRNDEGREFTLIQDMDVWAIPVPVEPADPTVFNRTAHRQLWLWLSENVDYRKEDWPGWRYYSTQSHDCFACGAAEAIHGMYVDSCKYCPLKWPKGKHCYNSLFSIWDATEDSRIRRTLARYIANLPVKDGYKYV